jgi:hypothetical protein
MPRLPSSRRGVVWFRWKILITISTALCILALFCINRQSNSTATTTTLSSSLSVARSRIPLVKYSGDRPKLAFLFLARRDLPLDFLWDRFFKVLKKNFDYSLNFENICSLLLCVFAECRSEEFLNLCTFNTWFRIR